MNSKCATPMVLKKVKHKIAAFYYTIGNLHPKWRSQTRWIFLAVLVKQQFLTANGGGYQAVLEPLLAALRCLEKSGVTVLTDVNCSKTVKGKLVSMSGDNLSSHMSGGFQQHFHADRICRSCLADYCEISEKFVQIRKNIMYMLLKWIFKMLVYMVWNDHAALLKVCMSLMSQNDFHMTLCTTCWRECCHWRQG